MNKKIQFTAVGLVVTVTAIFLIYIGLNGSRHTSVREDHLLFRVGVIALLPGLVVATIGLTTKKQ